MKSWLAAVLACAGLFASAFAPAADDQADLLTPAQRAWVKSHPRIVLGAGDDWAPWVIRDSSGALKGFAIDHLALINRRLGTGIRIEAGRWHEMVAKAESGAIDGLTLTAPLAERRDRFDFTEAFYTDHDFYFLRTEDLGRRQPSGLDDLRGKRVGYAKGTLRIERALAGHPGITAVTVEGYDELARLLLAGELDVAIASYSLEFWRASHGVLGFSPTRIVRETDARFVMTIRKDRAELVGILNAGLAALSKEELEPLYQRWFGADHLRRTATFAATFSTEERAWLQAHPVLRVGIDPRWAPVEFVNVDGAPMGMSLAYVERIGRMLGVRFEVVPGLSWTDAVAKLRERELDLLPAIAPTADRRGRMHFTDTYLSFPAAIFSAADVAFLGGLESLKGRRVAAVEGEAVVPWLRAEWPELDLVTVRDTEEALRLVAQGRAFAFVGNLVSTSYYIGQLGLTQIKVAGETPFAYQLGMAVREDALILKGILQKAIDAIPASEREAIYRDWISIRYQHGTDYALLWKIVLAAALLLLVVFVERTYRLNAANDRLQRLARELSMVGERERRQLAAELHDSPMQKLALAQMHFGSAGRSMPPAFGDRMSTGVSLLREALGELRTLQFELSPPMLYQEGLAPSLRWLASHVSERSGVAFTFRGSGKEAGVPQEIAVLLFQCARELAYNAARHSGATNGTIEIETGETQVLLTVSDNGKGLPDSRATTRPNGQGGFGLFGIRERLPLFGGELAMESGATGTRACVRIRLVAREAGAAPATSPGISARPPSGAAP